MEDNSYTHLAELFKLFGDETRLRILTCLLDGEMSVSSVATQLEMTQSAISHQLSTLRRSKLIRARREGKTVFYSLDDEHVEEILKCGIEHVRRCENESCSIYHHSLL